MGRLGAIHEVQTFIYSTLSINFLEPFEKVILLLFFTAILLMLAYTSVTYLPSQLHHLGYLVGLV